MAKMKKCVCEGDEGRERERKGQKMKRMTKAKRREAYDMYSGKRFTH